MFNNENCFSGISFLKNSKNYLSLLLLTIIWAASGGNGIAQWVNNPAVNTKLVSNCTNPVDISSVEDNKGGVFVFWTDKKPGLESNVYFMHADAYGNISFRADGKAVSGSTAGKQNPVGTASLTGSAAVLWLSGNNLFAQRVADNGTLLWTNNGVQVTNTNKKISDYSAAPDKWGNLNAAYILKEKEIRGNYDIEFQKIDPAGIRVFDSSSVNVYSTRERKSSTAVVPADSGVYIFWLEIINSHSVLAGQRINSKGNKLWGKKPVIISNRNTNVLTYSVKRLGDGKIYAAWQTQKSERAIYHQLISEQGKAYWKAGGELISDMQGSKSNPQFVTADSSVIICWTQESDSGKDIYIQKFNENRHPEWTSGGLPVVRRPGDQFGQKIIYDGNGGAIVAWIDRRSDSTLADIYSQRISASGTAMWEPGGIPVASFNNSLKSYLSLISDGKNGAIAVFRGIRGESRGIYVQKIFNTGTYISQIIGFTAETLSDSVKVSWYSANETDGTRYAVERTIQTDTGSTRWQVIDTLSSGRSSSAKYYEYYDHPNISGTLYYRIIQRGEKGFTQPSEVVRVNFFEPSEHVVVAQNNPNPFSDSTAISFYLPEPAKVTVEFFNSHVEKISEIKKQLFPAGENEINFSAEGLKPGIYFYRFTSGDVVEVKKMVIIK